MIEIILGELNIKGDKNKPEVKLDEFGVVNINGRSFPSNADDFYKPILHWLEIYGENPCPSTNVSINVDYINTTSQKYFLDIFRKFKYIKENGNTVNIYWFYDEGDTDMIEVGEVYSELTDIKFIFIKNE